jgi:hypothetical protein
MKTPGQDRLRKGLVALFCVILIGLLAACQFSETLSSKFNPLATPTETAQLTFTVTPTEETENCFWTWAYGAGSTEFDRALEAALAEKGIRASVSSSSFGENNSCGNIYGAMSLDMQIEVTIDDQTDNSDIAQIIQSLAKEKLSISQIPNLGNIYLTFAAIDNSASCQWDFSLNQCYE